jgi:hypothetical protein
MRKHAYMKACIYRSVHIRKRAYCIYRSVHIGSMHIRKRAYAPSVYAQLLYMHASVYASFCICTSFHICALPYMRRFRICVLPYMRASVYAPTFVYAPSVYAPFRICALLYMQYAHFRICALLYMHPFVYARFHICTFRIPSLPYMRSFHICTFRIPFVYAQLPYMHLSYTFRICAASVYAFFRICTASVYVPFRICTFRICTTSVLTSPKSPQKNLSSVQCFSCQPSPFPYSSFTDSCSYSSNHPPCLSLLPP